MHAESQAEGSRDPVRRKTHVPWWMLRRALTTMCGHACWPREEVAHPFADRRLLIDSSQHPFNLVTGGRASRR